MNAVRIFENVNSIQILSPLGKCFFMQLLTRRSLLATLAIAAFSGTTCKRLTAQTSSESTHCHTLVIGAGATGLAAARTLQDANCSVVVLEARDRLVAESTPIMILRRTRSNTARNSSTVKTSSPGTGCGATDWRPCQPLIAIATSLPMPIKRYCPSGSGPPCRG